MLRTFLRDAARPIWKHKVFSLIHVFGLALGISAFFLTYLYISYELSYDRYHTNGDRIYRLVKYDDRPSETQFSDAMPAMGPAFRKDYPEVQAMVRISPFRKSLVINGAKKFQEEKILFADSALFSIFSFPLLKGDAHKALTEPNSVVLSQTAARKYFGSIDVVGKPLLFDGSGWAEETFSATVTGVMQDIPLNSHFRSDIIVSTSDPSRDSIWDRTGTAATYLLLTANANPEQLRAKLPSFMARHSGNIGESAKHWTLSLEPLKDIYLDSRYGSPESGNIYNVYIFSAIAFLILLIACINFVNLSTARAIERTKEVCIRKIIGSPRGRLIRQFLGESVSLCVIAFLLALFFCTLFLPVFNQLCGKTVSRGIAGDFYSMALLLGISLFIGLAAGLYPALVLSSFKPALLSRSPEKGRVSLRKVLVVAQFTVSTILIIATLVIYRQMSYIRSQPLGFKKDQMLVIDFKRDTTIKNHIEAVKQALGGIPRVLSASASSGIPVSGFEPANYALENSSGTMQPSAIALYMVDEDFFHQYEIGLVAGRYFSKDLSTDPANALIVNRSTTKALGYSSPSAIIGKRFSGEDGNGTVVGVVKDFNFRSLREKITPAIFRPFFLANRYITLDISAEEVPSTIHAIASKWQQMEPQCPLDYFFLDEAIESQYRSETNFGRLFLYFGAFAIFISCLGLFGLTLISTYRRTKEIGIRKVMGASALRIINLLTLDFLRLVLIAYIIAAPIAWFGMNKWLEAFAYRITVNGWIFLQAGLAVTAVAFVTVSFQTARAARANPVESLRAE